MDIKYDQFIGIYENAIPHDVCQAAIDYYENAASLGLCFDRVAQGFGRTFKDNSILNIENTIDPIVVKNFTKCINPIACAVDDCYRKYLDKYGILAEMSRHRIAQSFQIQKTLPGQGYHAWHCEQDGIPNGSRLAVPLIYLNDVEEGGETEFLYQGLRIAPKEGTIILFPAGYTHAHRGNPPLKGDKYIATTWIEFVE